ncbi:MAG: YkgJ family cysteine cluster protein [bacterium]|nr:YkgJ family cysteine cluster protein [bacterium]
MNLLQIAPSENERCLPEPIQERLQALYEGVPGVSCGCDRPGQCCELTDEEMASDFATMYPIYMVEYLNIVDYVRANFDPQRQEALLGVAEERPRRCPFLTGEGGCSIHPARPLVCRTYGVLSREQVEETASSARGEVPSAWVASFLFTERHTVCPKTTVVEPEKVAQHAREMISFSYERDLLEMAQDVGLPDEDRRDALEAASGQREVRRWTWGGFNVLLRAPVSWLKNHFGVYWEKASLAE